jgi:hypothetical protein
MLAASTALAQKKPVVQSKPVEHTGTVEFSITKAHIHGYQATVDIEGQPLCGCDFQGIITSCGDVVDLSSVRALVELDGGSAFEVNSIATTACNVGAPRLDAYGGVNYKECSKRQHILAVPPPESEWKCDDANFAKLGYDCTASKKFTYTLRKVREGPKEWDTFVVVPLVGGGTVWYIIPADPLAGCKTENCD